MKKTLLFLLIAVSSSTISYSQKLDKIKGSKSVKQSERVFDTITGIELHKNIKLNLIQSQKNKLVIQADDNLHDVVETKVVDGVLDIDLTNQIASKKKLELNLYLTSIRQITLQDNATIYSSDFFVTEETTLNLNDNTEAILLFDSKKFNLNANDKSKANLVLKCEDVLFNLEEYAQIEAQAAILNLTINASQKASVTLKGETKHFIVKTDNSAKILSSNLKVKKANLEADRDSLVYLNVEDTLKIDASGKSKIHIYGKPKIDLNTFKDRAILFKE